MENLQLGRRLLCRIGSDTVTFNFFSLHHSNCSYKRGALLGDDLGIFDAKLQARTDTGRNTMTAKIAYVFKIKKRLDDIKFHVQL